MRVGHGFDAHRLVEGRPFVLAGVTIPFERGPLGHVLHGSLDRPARRGDRPDRDREPLLREVAGHVAEPLSLTADQVCDRDARVLEEQLVTRENQLAQAQGDIALGLIQVYRALGGGWQIRCDPAAALGPCAELSPERAEQESPGQRPGTHKDNLTQP